MGEARRRRLLREVNAPIKYRDARNAGDPLKFLEQVNAVVEAERRGERPVAKAPCNGCNQCCWFKVVDFNPNHECPEDLAHLDAIQIDDNTMHLRKRPDGACIHLGDNGCSVYDHRPARAPCRLYDCRVMALVGMVDTYDGGRQSPVWIFDPQTNKSKRILEAFRDLGRTYQVEAAKRGEAVTAGGAARFAFANIAEWFD